MDLDDMDLPKVNERKQQSKIQQNALKLELMKTIKEFEKQNNYKFESYEVDNILLEMVKRNHESYLNTKFGYDTV
jgi:hypothetical protein